MDTHGGRTNGETQDEQKISNQWALELPIASDQLPMLRSSNLGCLGAQIENLRSVIVALQGNEQFSKFVGRIYKCLRYRRYKYLS